MANPIKLYSPLLTDFSARGLQLSSAGSPVVVVNTDSKTAQSTPKDVYKHLSATGNSGNVRPIDTPEGTYLNLWHAFTGTSSPATPPAVRAFGLKKNPQKGLQVWPKDVDGTNFPTDLNAAGLNIADICDSRGFWVPLVNPTTDANLQTFSADIDMTVNGVWSISRPLRYHLEGCLKVVVFIDTAASGPTAGMILGGVIA